MEFLKGNLLEADAEALVNTVNTMGVMGKGIALQFKERFPSNFKRYAEACKTGEIAIGKLLVTRETTLQGDEKLIINFPTKKEWFRKSQYRYVEEGLKDLVHIIKEYNITSIAIPPLGSGNGGLDWNKVRPLIVQYLGDLPGVSVLIYEPNDAVKELLQKEASQKEIRLTPGRAMVLAALHQYEKLGETASVFAANKLAYFLQQSGEDLRLQFVPYYYGPYAQAIEKVLYSMNGKYLLGMEQMKAKPFEPLQLIPEKLPEVQEYIEKHLSSEQKQRLKNLFMLIEGFESTLPLEILATVHYLLSKNPQLTGPELLNEVQAWNKRKKNMIKAEYVNLAMMHLKAHAGKMSFS